MEMVWMSTFYKDPPIIGKEYIVTVYNDYWNEPKSMTLMYDTEEHNRTKQYVWKLDGKKIPSTWRVTHWMNMPKPARDDE